MVRSQTCSETPFRVSQIQRHGALPPYREHLSPTKRLELALLRLRHQVVELPPTHSTAKFSGGHNEYSVADFDTNFLDFGGNLVSDILSANLILTIDDPFYAASGDYVILFTTDSVENLSTAANYDQLEYNVLSTNGIDTSDFADTPVVVGSGSFSDAIPGGFVDVVSIDLTSIEAELITAINNRDSFHFIIGSVDSDNGAVTFGIGNTNNRVRRLF